MESHKLPDFAKNPAGLFTAALFVSQVPSTGAWTIAAGFLSQPMSLLSLLTRKWHLDLFPASFTCPGTKVCSIFPSPGDPARQNTRGGLFIGEIIRTIGMISHSCPQPFFGGPGISSFYKDNLSPGIGPCCCASHPVHAFFPLVIAAKF